MKYPEILWEKTDYIDVFIDKENIRGSASPGCWENLLTEVSDDLFLPFGLSFVNWSISINSLSSS